MRILKATSNVRLPKRSDINKMTKEHGFRIFCRETSLHGLKYIGAQDIAGHRRLFWIIAVVIVFCTCCWFSNWFIQSYSLKAVTTTIDTTTAPLSEVFFPSVTVCNVNQLQQSFLDFLNMTREQFELFEKEFIVGRDINTTEAELAAIDTIIKSPSVVNAYIAGFSEAFSMPPEDVKHLLEIGTVSIELGLSRMAIQIQKGAMVPYAKYQTTEHFHELSAFMGTDFGICIEIIPYTFNITGNIFKQPPPGLKDAKPGVTNGENNGMVVLLDAEVYDYAYKNRGGEGFKVALHHHRDIAVMRQMGFNVAPGSIVNVAVKPILTYTTEAAKNRFNPKDRDCYFEDEIELSHWPYNATITTDVSKRGQEGRYGITNCLLEAALQQIAQECQCAPSFHPLGFDLKKFNTCQGYGITCVNEILDQLGDIDTIVDKDEVKKCYAPCEDQINTFQLSSLNFPNRNTFRFRPEVCYVTPSLRRRCLNPHKRRLLNKNYPNMCDLLEEIETSIGEAICDQSWHLRSFAPNEPEKLDELIGQLFNYCKENLLMLNIFIKDPYVTRLKRDEAFPVIVFVAGLGGLLGVFTGFSFISLAEVFYFIGDAFAAYITKPRHTFREKS